MRLIVGLGNYPPKYEKTRHNMGFLAIDVLAKKYNFPDWKKENKFYAECSYGEIKGLKTILCKPHTFMNASGDAVGKIQRFYKIELDDIWVISDDLDQDFEAHRFREKGSSGGQKGIESIIQTLGTDQFPRLKFGISNDKRSYFRTEDFVVSRFTPDEFEKLPEIFDLGLKKMLDRW